MNMNENVSKYLQQIGLSEIETDLYIILLSSGPISVRDLARVAGIKRTTSYLYIDQLINKGLIIKVVKGSKKLIDAVKPEEAVRFLVSQKLETAQTLKKSLPIILHNLEDLQLTKNISDEAEIKYFKGMNTIKSIYTEALKSKELRTYVKLEESSGIFQDNKNLFNNAFMTNKDLIVKELIYASPLIKEKAPELLTKNKRYFYKLVPEELKLTSGDTLIFDGNVAIINYKNKTAGVLLNNRDYFNNSKEIFDFMWKSIA